MSQLLTVADGHCPACGRSEPLWTPDAIIRAMHNWTSVHERPPLCDEWRKAERGHPARDTVQRVFGSWSAAILAAGFGPANQTRWTPALVKHAIFTWRYHHGRLPRAHEWQGTAEARGPEYPSYRTVVRLFGTWNNAIREAGYEPTRERRRA